MRTLRILALAVTSFAVAACAATVDSNAPDETDDALTSQAGGYFVGKAPSGNGRTSVHLANASSTKCADGSKKSACSVATIDYSNLGLSESAKSKLDAAFGDGHAILKGKLSKASSPTLTVDAAWSSAGGNDPGQLDSVFLITGKIQNQMCMQNSACTHYHEAPVNKTTGKIDIVDVDLSHAGGSKSEVTAGQALLDIGADGLLVLGVNHGVISNHTGTGTYTLAATDFYLPVKASSSTNACQAAGGTCVPLVPDACAIGTVGDGNTYSCGGGLGVQCCLPLAPPDPGPSSCMGVDCAPGMHCEMKGLNGGAVPVCINN